MNPTDQLGDIYGPWHVPFWARYGTLCMIIGALIIGTFVVCAVWWIIRGRLRPERNPWDEALTSLHELKAMPRETHEQIKYIYGHMLAILKRYVTRRYGHNVQGHTDDELLALLVQEKLFPNDLYELVEQVMRDGGAARFAGVHSSGEQCVQHVRHMEHLITATIPAEKEA